MKNLLERMREEFDQGEMPKKRPAGWAIYSVRGEESVARVKSHSKNSRWVCLEDQDLNTRWVRAADLELVEELP